MLKLNNWDGNAQVYAWVLKTAKLKRLDHFQKDNAWQKSGEL